MTKKDFKFLAQILLKTKPVLEDSDCYLYVVETFTEELKSINPRFNPDKFLEACKISKESLKEELMKYLLGEK